MNPSSRGHFFEAVKHSVMCSGGRREYRFLDVPGLAPARPGRPSKQDIEARQAAFNAAATAQGSTPDAPLFITTPSLQQEVFEAGSVDAFKAAVEKSTSPRYLRPDDPFQPIFDACIYPDTLLQFTVSTAKNEVNVEELERYLQCLPEREKYHLDYAVSAAHNDALAEATTCSSTSRLTGG